MSVLKIDKLCKQYPSFKLDNVSFEMREGTIMGFIGRNGAGKTTTLKSLLDIVHPDSGTIEFFGKDFKQHEFDIKQDIGFVLGGINYYSMKKLRTITDVTRRFYSKWDEKAYEGFMKEFGLDDRKTPHELSEGMKVKYALTLALSHNAKLLILDEPTSGLDPVSREDLLDVFLDLEDRGISILFSTHITSDLDKCADDITYIKEGKIIASENMKEFVSRYKVVELADSTPSPELAPLLIGCKRAKSGSTALVLASDAPKTGLPTSDADLEAIMVHFEKE